MTRRPPCSSFFPYTTLFRSAVVQGVDLRKVQEKIDDQRAQANLPQPSLQDVAAARALKARDLELREQELRNQLNLIRQEQSKRSEEHTSELQSQSNLVCRLL